MKGDLHDMGIASYVIMPPEPLVFHSFIGVFFICSLRALISCRIYEEGFCSCLYHWLLHDLPMIMRLLARKTGDKLELEVAGCPTSFGSVGGMARFVPEKNIFRIAAALIAGTHPAIKYPDAKTHTKPAYSASVAQHTIAAIADVSAPYFTI
jgi:hypothetical protein